MITYTREEALSFVATALAIRSIRTAQTDGTYYPDQGAAAIACNTAAADALGIGPLYRQVLREHSHSVPPKARDLIVWVLL